jgi:L-threonylcarbamoyladenylate synthase
VGVESTIISFADKEPLLLRPGGLGVEEVEAVIGPLVIPARTDARPLSPGRLPAHYAPRTPLALWSGGNLPIDGRKIGLLTLQSPPNQDQFVAVEVLSRSGDLKEAAANLFAAMRRLDALGLDLILAQPVTDRGIGLAINDRLLRASAGSGLHGTEVP